jgi:CRP-like cAMP-binding protein
MWFFEVCVIVMKLLLAGALSVIAPHSPLQLFIGLLICLAFLLLTVRLAPYKEDGHDVMSIVVFTALTLTMLIGALKSTHECQTGQNGECSSSPSTRADKWQNLNPQALGGLLIAINCMPFVCLVGANLFWVVQARRKRRGTQRGDEEDFQRHLISAIVPVSIGEKTRNSDLELVVRTPSSVARNVMREHDASARRHAARQEKRQAQSHRKTMMRLHARANLKKSRKLKGVSIFQDLNEEALSAVIDKMKMCIYGSGDVIVQQGDEADSFFVIIEGACDVSRKTLVNLTRGQVIARLGMYEHFGEAALTTAARRVLVRNSGMSGTVVVGLRNATISAVTDEPNVKCLVLAGKDLEAILSSGSVDLEELKGKINEHARRRESFSATRRLLERSQAYATLQSSRSMAAAATKGRSLFDE